MKWVECEAISFNDVRDKNLHGSNYRHNVLNSPQAGPSDNTDRRRRWQCLPPGPRSGLHVTDLSAVLSAQTARHVCLVSILDPKNRVTGLDISKSGITRP